MVRVYAARISGKKLSHAEESRRVRWLLDMALTREYPEISVPVFVEKDLLGKPFLRDYPEVFVSLSHSGGYVACAFGEKPVGVDIEEWKERRSIRRIVEKCHPLERAAFLELKEEEKQKGFHDLWVLKESFMKAEGSGLRIPLDSFRMKSEQGGNGQVEQKLNNRSFYFRLYSTDSEAVSLAACAEEADFSEEPFWITLPEEFSGTEGQVQKE